MSIGRDPDWHVTYTMYDKDYRGKYNGVYAYATGHHCQFVSIAGVAVGAAKYDNCAMGNEKPFDIALDQIGLRLSTVKRYSRHIGNVIHDELRQEIQEQGLC